MMEIKTFLECYTGNIKYHNATYDIKVLIRWLWMSHLLDTEGLLKGLEVLTRDFDCTQAITYLATNSTAGNKLSLKDQSQEFLGNYAVDVQDIRKVSTRNLMIYNLRDCLATWFVYDKHYPTMVQDQQLHFYETMAKPILKNLIQMELTGMPLNIERVQYVNHKLERIVSRYEKYLLNCQIIKKFVLRKRQQEVLDRNAAYKTKVIDINEAKYQFNPGSGQQVAELLHDYIGFEVFSKTPSGQPATGADELKGHIKRTDNKEYKNILRCIVKMEEGKKILSTFISKFLDAERDDDGWYWLFGSFKFGGAKSYRISSSDPNLMNLPAHGIMGKLVKSCFQAPRGFIFCGLDYASLEDRINTILTQDPNKRKVYTDGFDGHSYRAISYWPDKFPDVDINDPKSVNAIKNTPEGDVLRSKSKPITFALTYQGTWSTLVTNCGFTPEEAKVIEARYHELYKVSDEWMAEKIQEASKNGYVELAFGGRLRCPVLKQTVLGSKYTPNASSAEARTVGNAVGGQSYCQLNLRLAFKLMEAVKEAGYVHQIRQSASVHDATYLVVEDNVHTVHWLNKTITELALWKDLPELYDPEIPLGGELDLFPTWATPITLPADASKETIRKLCNEFKQKN